MTLDPSQLDAVAVAGDLDTDPDRGLTAEEAARRLAEYGPNEVQPAAPVPAWRRLLAQFQSGLIYLLLGAVVLSGGAWLIEGAEGWPVDTLVIVAVILLNAAIGFVQENRAETAVAALRQMSTTTATVIRDGQQLRVPSTEVVPGDLLVLGEGDAVAADARLVSAAALKVSEASLTGESEPVLKDATTLSQPASIGDRFNMVFSGTAVTQGTGRAIVTATGMATEMGTIARLLRDTPEDPTPLQREITHLGRMIGIAVLIIAAVVIVTVLLTSDVRSVEELITVLLLGVALAVAAVPEGLPAILSVVLALGVRTMASHRAIVKKLSSVETLGSASVICSDKTGTLTRSEMTIERVVTASGEVHISGDGYRPEGRVEKNGSPLSESDPMWNEVAAVLGGGSLANNASLRRTNGEWTIQGDPTEAAFLVAEHKLGTAEARTDRFTRVAEIPFTSERKMMSTLETDAEREGRIAVVAKGAPDVLLGRCTHVLSGSETVPLDDAMRARVLRDVDRLSAEAYRTLAVAFAPLDVTEVPQPGEHVERGLVYAGMVGIIDPPRTEAADAVREARRAGVRVIMITGDHPLTAGRIAAELGIVEPDSPVLTGSELAEMDSAELAEAVRNTSVYARVAPQHKLDIVDALQANGDIVAMTGDGVNDAPALRSADIGIAMGITGTEVTKEAARMILADDNFATIVRAVRQGRIIFDNIKKFLRYLMSSNMGEVLAVFFGVVLAGLIGLSSAGQGIVLPLLITQILWVNLVTDTTLALAMGVDPEVDDVMSRPPRRLGDRVMDAPMWRTVFSIGTVMAAATLLTIDIYLPGGLIEGHHDLDNARTAGFTVLVLAQIFNALSSRSETTSAFRGLFANRWLWGAIALTFALQLAVVHLPVLNVAFGTAALSGQQWLACLAMASSVLWFGELSKFVRRRMA